MKLWLTATFFVIFVQFAANGVNITNNTHVVRADKNGETVVCNQYVGQGAETSEAIKKTWWEAFKKAGSAN